MALYLKSPTDIAALISGPDYAAIDPATKTKIALHFEEMPASVVEAAFEVIVATLPTDQANFARALFTDAPTAPGTPTTPTPPPTTPTASNERIGQVAIPAGADRVAVTFTPPFASVPLTPWASVQRTNDAADEIGVQDCVDVTPAGFTATLDAPTPSSGYLLSYRAVTGAPPTLSQPFDFAVLRYQWTSADGTDLDTRTALVAPSVEGDVGWSRQTRVPASGSPGPFLIWGGDNTSATGAEAVLIDFAAVAAAYPAAATIIIRLRANWYGARADGSFNVQFATYLGGTMQPSGTDFVNAGGVAVQTINTPRSASSNVPGDVDGDDLGLLLYDAATRTATITLPGAAAPAESVNGVLTASARVVRTPATKSH